MTTPDPFARYQNPLWPPDAAMSTAEMEVMARASSFHRAQSPGDRICKIDQVLSPDEPGHVHGFQECMDYRHNNVVGDDESWMYWLLYDDWFQLQQPAPLPPPVPRPVGWFPMARINPTGIPFMNGWSQGWVGYSFSSIMGPSRVQKIAHGSKTRVTLQGDCVFDKVFLGPLTTNPRIASELRQLTFNGGSFSGTTSLEPDWQLVSDEMPWAFDAPNGMMLTGHISAPHSGTYAWLRTRNPEADWYSVWRQGDHAAELDKTGGNTSTVADLAVVMVEQFF